MKQRKRTTRHAAIVAAAGAIILAIGSPGVAAADGSASFGSLDTGSAEAIGGGVLNAFVPGLGDLVFGSSDGSSGGGGGSPGVQRCNQQTNSGGQGITETKHLTGRAGPTDFTLLYDTENIPDRIETFYQGRRIHDTGYIGDNINAGNGSARIAVPRGADDFVTVKVTGPDSGTVWHYTVYCPS